MDETNSLIARPDGTCTWRGRRWRCAIGNGSTASHVEGDGMSPIGAFPLRELLYRADRMAAPKCFLPAEPITPEMLWSDDVEYPDYNRRISAPYAGSHEELMRQDHVYDIIVPLGYNDDPPVPGKGSAIFLHIAREAFTPTAGCVALSLEDMLTFLAEADEQTTVTITA